MKDSWDQKKLWLSLTFIVPNEHLYILPADNVTFCVARKKSHFEASHRGLEWDEGE